MTVPAPPRTILLVEDNPDEAELALRALRKTGIGAEVVVARDGEAALAHLGLAAEPGMPGPAAAPGLVLLDLELPRIDGFEVLRRIRHDPRTRFLPVVILSSSNEDADLLRGYELGANSYVRKPVDFAELVTAARELGLYWLILNLTPGRAVPR